MAIDPNDIFEIHTPTEEEIRFQDDMLSHREPICPKCGIGRVVCPSGKISRPHFFICTKECGWHCNIDYNDVIVE